MTAQVQGSGPVRVHVASCALLALVPLAACHDSNDGGGGADTLAPSLTAMPAGATFVGASVDVTLTATDAQDANPTIYYTTDLSTPTTMSTVYAGPITITDTSVVKAIAVDASGNQSDVFVKGYVDATSPIAAQWATSGHGDITAEAWRRWDEDTEVSTRCARCHGDGGLKDYAADGVVDNAGALPLGLACTACHTTLPTTIYGELGTYPALEPVAFPSGETASLWAKDNICFTCHQGRNSTVQVDASIAGNPGGPYTFINIHYYAAGATYFGDEVKGGYQYPGMEYAGRNTFPSHDAAQQDCTGCHMRGANLDHSFLPQIGDCTTCHTATGGFETLSGSPAANFAAIETSAAELLAAIQAYATATIGTPIVYDSGGYPYFFVDTNGNGVSDDGEASFGNRYAEFDEKLLKAAYNYQVIAKDPAGFIHNGTYLRQLLHDSIVDLGALPSVPAPGRPGFDLALASKAEQWHLSGHAHSTAEAFRHWDEDDPAEVRTSCARCHTTTGFVDYLADGTVDAPAPLGELVDCAACHGDMNLFMNPDTRYADLVTNMALEPVLFPSGQSESLSGNSNICMSCHQGRESGVSVDANADNMVVQTPIDYPSFNFVNRHYYAAAAILFGSNVTAAYQYAGAPPYASLNTFPAHPAGLSKCTDCHMRGVEDHTFQPQLTDCSGCHLGITEFEELGRPFGNTNIDYDGDGTGESFQDEIDGMAADLYAAIQTYAGDPMATVGLPQPSPVVYAPTSYPYWFKDSDNDGLLTEGEDSYGNRYQDFDRRLLRAAFNYHAAQDPCSDIHNYRYTLQTLYDSIDDLDDGLLNSTAPGTRP